jgi:hypothetical protein
VRLRALTWRPLRRPRAFTLPASAADTPPPPARDSRADSRDLPHSPARRPPAPFPAPGDDDRRSRRMALASALLRRDDIHQVAAITDVPAALLELMSDGLSNTGRDRRLPRQRKRPRRTRLARQRILAAVIIEVAAIANITACIVALLRHDADLGMLTGVIAAVLTVAVVVAARLLSPAPTTAAAQRRSLPAAGVKPSQEKRAVGLPRMPD